MDGTVAAPPGSTSAPDSQGPRMDNLDQDQMAVHLHASALEAARTAAEAGSEVGQTES